MIAMLLFAVGVYLTIYLKFMPIKHIGRAFRTVLSSRGEGGQITAFSSLCTTLGAIIGIGNIVGVASAVAVGGPGTLFWMLAAAFFGMTTKYAENLLGALYRRKDKSGTFLGGPFYYIRFGLGERYRLLANVFAVSCLLAGILGMGTVTQSNSIYGAVSVLFADHISDTEIVKILTAGALTLLTGIVILGGGKRIAKVSELLVPLMSAAYIVLCLVILFRFRHQLPSALKSVLQCAFSPRAAFGSAAGISVQQLAVLGIRRGIFSNEAGLGTSAIAAASAETGDCVTQGYSGIVSVFVGTVILCTLTGLTVIVTGALEADGVKAANAAWELGLSFNTDVSKGILNLFLIIFGFTSILGWNFYVERCLAYLFRSSRITKVYQFLYLAAVFSGPYLSAAFAWKIADVTNVFLALPNVFALFLLRKKIAERSPI